MFNGLLISVDGYVQVLGDIKHYDDLVHILEELIEQLRTKADDEHAEILYTMPLELLQEVVQKRGG